MRRLFHLFLKRFRLRLKDSIYISTLYLTSFCAIISAGISVYSAVFLSRWQNASYNAFYSDSTNYLYQCFITFEDYTEALQNFANDISTNKFLFSTSISGDEIQLEPVYLGSGKSRTSKGRYLYYDDYTLPDGSTQRIYRNR